MCPVLPRHVELRVAFRSGLRWPLRENDSIEVWRGNELLGSLSGETVRHLIQHHITEFEVHKEISRDMTGTPRLFLAVPRKPLAFTASQKEEHRARRKTKRK